jgi:CDP-diacylglycerol--glycerol-3-phosphate 3-phosphatidyltransferase
MLAAPRPVGRVGTVPNIVTAVRTVASVAIGLAGVAGERPLLLLVAYAVYWVGDIADGWLARRLGQATRLGAVFDIVSDRACAAVLCVGVVAHTPQVTVVVGVFLLTFLVLDAMLSLAFLCWPIDTPNDFWQVDRAVYRLNWSPLAKAANTAGVVGAIALGAAEAGLALGLAVIAVKAWSTARVLRLLDA